MKHYVIINEWASEYECVTSVLGVTHSLEEAKEIFNKSLMDEKRYAEEKGFTIYDDCETVFDAGAEEYYVGNHTSLYIQMVIS